MQWKQTKKNNIARYLVCFYYLIYQDKIYNLEGYIFQKLFTIKQIWDGLPVFTQETIYRVRTEMKQCLIVTLFSS